jgi:hypothetical protein
VAQSPQLPNARLAHTLTDGIRGWDLDRWTSSDDRVRGGKSQVPTTSLLLLGADGEPHPRSFRAASPLVLWANLNDFVS